MTGIDWTEASLSAAHDRKAFDCGEPELNTYLQRYARQNHASGGAKCFVAVHREAPERILGFYTMSPASLAFARTPAIVQRGLARYDVPVYRLGRLAVDRMVQDRGLGSQLLLAAGARALLVAEQAGGVALLIDAKNERIAAWYAEFGAVALADAPLTLLLPFRTLASAIVGSTA